MRKILLTLSLLPLLSWAQNPLDLRITTPKSASPSINAEVIDGRESKAPSFHTPAPFVLRSEHKLQSIHYWLRYSSEYGLPNYLHVYQPKIETGFGIQTEQHKLGIDEVFADLPGLFDWEEKTTLEKVSQTTDDLGYEHYRYTQHQNGVPVRGGQWNIHLKDDAVLKASGRIYPSSTIDVNGILTERIAASKAEKYIYEQICAYVPQQGTLFDRNTHADLQVDYEIGKNLKAQLVYVVEVRPTNMRHYNVWVDAHTGNVLKVQDELCSIDGPKVTNATDLNNASRTVNSYQVGSTYYLVDATKSMWTNSQPSAFPDNPVGAVWTIDAGNTAATSISHVTSNNNSWSDKSAVSAHANAGLAFDYFKNIHSRNSINGNGGSIISVVNVADEGGGNLDNAYWNGQAMFYGNGNTAFTPLAGALDVAGHELSHGVVSNTANLEYQGQSGAINESMADVFGAMIDRDDWKMGEDIVRPGVFAGGALRDLQNPHNGGNSLNDRGYQPEKMSEYYTGTADNGGVHINSGIVNRAFYLTADAIGKVKAEKIWYRALVQYLTNRSQFLDLRYACVDAAEDLYGTTEITAVKNAFDTVQIYDPNGDTTGGGAGGGSTGGDLPTNTGTEFLISLDVDVTNSNTWYRSSTTPDNYEALTTTNAKRPCSITDKGDAMFYIDAASKMRAIELSGAFPESQINNDNWNNVAISKDGNRIAAISAAQDNKLYIYDYETSTWKIFTLYNPTYTQGVDAGNVNYADALEWDNTGQYVLYDAQNEITNSSGNDITYWDVGLIRVWDNATDDFGDGKVDKLFTQLPEGVSIGNGSFSKNSPNIIAFDVISSTGVEVSATNTLTNTTEVIFSQDILGYPNFSNKDDKLIFDAENTGGSEVVAVINLADSKIEPAAGASAAVLTPDAKWGKWYANGTRSLLSNKKDILSFSFPSVDNTATATIDGTDISIELPNGTDPTSLTPTFTHSTASEVLVAGDIQVSGVNTQDFSSTKVYTVKAQDGSTKNYNVNVTISTISSVRDISPNARLYPNPTNGYTYVQGISMINSIEVYTALGQSVWVPYTQNAVDLRDLPTGIYNIHIYTDGGIAKKRIVKQ